jgi:hypothetical protein
MSFADTEKKSMKAYMRQHAWIMLAIAGSTLSGMGSLRCWKPTAPTTWNPYVYMNSSTSVTLIDSTN